jgi:hypothetical protein
MADLEHPRSAKVEMRQVFPQRRTHSLATSTDDKCQIRTFIADEVALVKSAVDYPLSAFSSAFAFSRSGVPNPSVNQL